MAAIVTEANGSENIGTAFHVGEGVFVTARHVVENRQIREIRLTDPDLFYRSDLYPKNEDGSYTVGPNSQRMCVELDGSLKITAGPFFHPDPLIDIAGIKVTGMQSGAHYVPLGGHLDDWVASSDFVLTKALILGYPPIPFTLEPVLVAASCEVNANVDLRTGDSRQLHFILSATPRGGFSGGLAVSEYGGVALGIITQSLINNDQAPELGFFATTSIEAIYICLQEAGILPDCQKEGWDGLWDDTPEERKQ